MLNEEEAQDFLKALGSRIRQLRKEKGLDMRAIMIASGYYDAQWRKYESGSSMNVVSLMRVAYALDVSFSELLDGLGQWPRLTVEEIRAKNVEELGTDAESDAVLETSLPPDPEPEPMETLARHPARKRVADKKTPPAKAASKSKTKAVKESTITSHQTIRDTSSPRNRKS